MVPVVLRKMTRVFNFYYYSTICITHTKYALIHHSFHLKSERNILIVIHLINRLMKQDESFNFYILSTFVSGQS